MTISSEQCRAARALLGWSQDQLAEASKVAKATIANFEAGKRTPYDRTIDDIRDALDHAGIEFIPQNGAGAGVRFRRLRAGDKVIVRSGSTYEMARFEKRQSIGEIIEAADLPANGFRVRVRFPDEDDTAFVDANMFVLVAD
jgi:transcriptional regulator with XRE-family HTH domain